MKRLCEMCQRDLDDGDEFETYCPQVHWWDYVPGNYRWPGVRFA